MSPRIWEWVDKLPAGCSPRMIRGDIGFGNERYLHECELRNLPHLFKLKITTNIKKLIRKLAIQQGHQWDAAPGGWDVIESRVKLSGWSRERRVVVMRRPVPANKSHRKKENDWLPLLQVEAASHEWEYAVLVCSQDIPIDSSPKLYAERADCENVLDEVKNQWGLRGFTTQDLSRGKVMARLNALVYNWWNVFVRIAEPTEHKEAITSRPELLQLIATLTTHAGENVLRFSSLHENSHLVKRTFDRLHTVLSHIDANAEQLDRPMVWAIHLSVAFYAWLRGKILKVPQIVEKIIKELMLDAATCRVCFAIWISFISQISGEVFFPSGLAKISEDQRGSFPSNAPSVTTFCCCQLTFLGLRADPYLPANLPAYCYVVSRGFRDSAHEDMRRYNGLCSCACPHAQEDEPGGWLRLMMTEARDSQPRRKTMLCLQRTRCWRPALRLSNWFRLCRIRAITPSGSRLANRGLPCEVVIRAHFGGKDVHWPLGTGGWPREETCRVWP